MGAPGGQRPSPPALAVVVRTPALGQQNWQFSASGIVDDARSFAVCVGAVGCARRWFRRSGLLLYFALYAGRTE
eukprot:11717453-Alexandrium_andersonii.AAC.1